MKRKSKAIIVLATILLTILAIISICLILRKQHQLKIESTNINQRKEVTDKNETKSVEEVLSTVFKSGDALDKYDYSERFYYKVVDSFTEGRDNSISELSYWNFWHHILHQTDENKDKENMKTSINLIKIYDLGNKNYEDTFFVEREFNHKNDSKVIKTKENYYVKFDYNTNKFLISELYDIDDFNNYVNRHLISRCVYTKKELIYKYQEFRKYLYHELGERYIHEDWFKKHGYKI